MNKVILVGNATRDAELRYTQNGKPVSNYSASNESTAQGRGRNSVPLHHLLELPGRNDCCRGAGRRRLGLRVYEKR